MASIHLLNNATHSQMLSLLVTDADTVLAIDGGTAGDTDNFLSYLSSVCPHAPHVDAWLITHPHHDHISVLCSLLEQNAIPIGRIYHHLAPLPYLEKFGRGGGELSVYRRLMSLADERFVQVHAGDILACGRLTATVMRTYNEAICRDVTNNSSTVYKITHGEKSLLVLGDLGRLGGYDLMQKVPAEALFADFTQMAHHGQSAADQTFYNYIMPRACLWPTPDWLWDNDAGDGFDTGPWTTVRTREWMDALGVHQHYIEKDGPLCLPFE